MERDQPHRGRPQDQAVGQRQRLIALLDTLPVVERAAYVLSAADGLSHGAIAFRLGVSIGEVETALAGALSKLTEGLDEP
ncbi:DNA-directed RNA polymerase specialized sigma24 family protein [Novosphingobium sp. SG751A]|uniref:RNA polymerase sigma factor n=1 Tax=Novosphingobium sp. SG751A TaxID=2587000 RepID=UPI001556A2EF|nr:sigma-70 region 4 domain-containing protein [Novosphingobium sp. SG751A]NOW48523.1 DNA-directed RNA polymerase specialized sigma24 family protein [Novosphingobium sp. SG751A]